MHLRKWKPCGSSKTGVLIGRSGWILASYPFIDQEGWRNEVFPAGPVSYLIWTDRAVSKTAAGTSGRCAAWMKSAMMQSSWRWARYMSRD